MHLVRKWLTLTKECREASYSYNSDGPINFKGLIRFLMLDRIDEAMKPTEAT